jgi:hypothetical protein
MLLRHLTQRHARAAVCDNLHAIDVQRTAADSPTFQFCSSHSGLNSFDDQAALQLGDRSDDYDHRTAQWPARVDVFSKAYELYTQAVQLMLDFAPEIISVYSCTISYPRCFAICRRSNNCVSGCWSAVLTRA